MTLRRILLSSLALTLVPTAAVFGQAEPGNVTRADFAAAYVRFERALLENPLDPSGMERANREFDALSLEFFMGRHAEAVKRLHELTASLDETLSADPEAAATAALRVRMEPAVWVSGAKIPLELHLSALYTPPERKEATRLSLRISGSSPGETLSFPLLVDWKSVSLGKLVYPLDLKTRRLKPGMYEVALVTPGGNALLGSTWSVVSRPPDALGRENALRLDKAAAEHPSLAQAWASTAARNSLLTDASIGESTARLTLDPEKLLKELEKEIRELERGRNPFRARKGDVWRVMRHGDEEIPFRVFLSDNADLDRPLPLVVAFHGAGGDENMFLEGYGSGILKRLAGQRKFLLVSPRTQPFLVERGGEMFEALVNLLEQEYPLDRKRLYLLGHSLGGMTVNALLARGAANVAAACCLCGFQGFGPAVGATPPVLVVAAALDPIVPPSRLEPAARRAAEAGRPVAYRLVEGFGHTLVVGRIMSEVLDWLFER
ncbi:MAG: hypothetical protein FJY83_02750 [Candidatus Aminicenantes bacterium]|nr:hypothetical protein [Candidatus Aminicenantes bacterium]